MGNANVASKVDVFGQRAATSKKLNSRPREWPGGNSGKRDWAVADTQCRQRSVVACVARGTPLVEAA